MSGAAAEELIRRLRLEPHPEGGFFRETYRSHLPVTTPHGERAASTAIYFLLREGELSRLHRIKSDELWHFHAGGPLTVAALLPDGSVRRSVLGPDPAAGQAFQLTVPAGSWFGARPEPGAGFTLAGCTVAPGFDFADFELADRAELLRRYPAAAALIEEFTLSIKGTK